VIKNVFRQVSCTILCKQNRLEVNEERGIRVMKWCPKGNWISMSPTLVMIMNEAGRGILGHWKEIKCCMAEWGAAEGA
jgi:hypothetical protein